jgi:DNA repair exonuclease SbcCD ATPase subunit
MLSISSLKLENVVLFKDVDFEFIDGLTTIRGHNQDSQIADDQNNGAGKSLLLSTIPNVLYNAPPLARKKKAKKDMLGKGSRITVDFDSGMSGKAVKIEQTGSKYKVFENGTDTELRTIPLAESYIGREFPISPLEFYSSVYIQSQRECPFQKGTESERMHFISEVFRLDAYDRLKEHFAQKLRDVKDRETEYATLSGKRTSTEAKLKKNTWTTDSQVDLDRLEAELDKVQDLRDSAAETLQFEQNMMRGARQLQELELELDEFRAKYKFRKHPHEMLPVLKRMLKVVSAYEEYQQALAIYKEDSSELNARLRELPKGKDPSSLKDEGTSIVDALERLEEEYEELENKLEHRSKLSEAVSDWYRDIASLGHKAGKVPSTNVEEQIAALRTTISLKKLLKTDDATCPTCHSDLDLKQIRRSVTKAEQALPKLLDLQSAQELQATWYANRKELSKLDDPKEEMLRIEESMGSLEERLHKVREEYKLQSERVQVERDLERIRKPKALAKPKTNLTKRQIEDGIELCNEIMHHIKAREAIWKSFQGIKELFDTEDDPLEAQTSEYEDAKSYHDKLRADAASHSKRIRELEVERNTHTLLNQELDEIEEQLSKLSRSIRKKKIYESLVAAYGSKGIKTLAIQKIAEVLEANLNVYRSLVFAEPFRFKIEVTKSGMRVEVDRRNGHKSDIRLLSGSEADCFRLLFMVALLPLVPSERRTNFCVLDEPDAHMDPATRDRFATHFLPALQQIVPSVNLITPLPTEYDSARELVVVKRDGVSTLKEAS